MQYCGKGLMDFLNFLKNDLILAVLPETINTFYCVFQGQSFTS